MKDHSDGKICALNVGSGSRAATRRQALHGIG